MALPLQYYTVDAFTREPFAGNAAAVFVLPPLGPEPPAPHLTDELCQKIANEFNLAETAFTRKLIGGGEEEEEEETPSYSLRFWTPTYEIPLCGHATLAAASTLFARYHTSSTTLRLETRTRGSLIARKDLETGMITIDLPRSSLVTLEPGHRRRAKVLEGVEKIFDSEHILRIDWADEISAYVVELSTDVNLEALEIDPLPLLAIGEMIILTQPAPPESGFDIHSRVFGPDTEIPEDPVTGSAHTALAPFWLSTPSSLARLTGSEKIKVCSTLRAKQVSKRGGEMVVHFDRESGRVSLSSWAREVMNGQLQL